MRRVLIACVVSGISSASLGGVSLVSNEASFATSDTIQWSQFGPTGASVPGLVGGTSVSGRSFWAESYSSDASGLSRVDQWAGAPDPFSGWAGNFGANAALLRVSGQDLVSPPTTDARLSLTFSEAIRGFGAQFDASFSNSWIMHVGVFDVEDNMIGLFDLSMKRIVGSMADNSAKFMGVRSDSANIARLEIWATAIYNTDFGPIIAPDYFAMNFGRLEIPAPGSALLAIGLGSMLARRRRI
ncbi:MAG: hypothetical protein KF691_01690 [Phycisphaeraceae bacterium]|nr:hypothetical protein [Phycisphaeraceae bacterium]